MHSVALCDCVHCSSQRFMLAFFGITLRAELMRETTRDAGSITFLPLRARFNDVLETTERFPDFEVRHCDDSVACLSLLFCLRRFALGAATEPIEVKTPASKA